MSEQDYMDVDLEHNHRFLQTVPNMATLNDGSGDASTLAVTVFDLPWEDVVFQYIFPLLPIQTLFHLRIVSSTFHQMVREFFSTAKQINIARIGGKVTTEAFHILTDESSNLVHLNLRSSKDWLKDSLLTPVFKNNTRLQILDLTNCTSITNISLQIVATHCPELKSLTLRDCVWLSPEGVMVLGLHCKLLEKVDLTGCWNVDDESVIVLVKGCTSLTSIQLAKIYGLTDASMTILCRCSANLVHLNVQGCWRISDDSIRFLVEYGRGLKMLQIRDCQQVTEMTLSKLREKGVRMDRLAPPSSDRRMDKLLSHFRNRLNVQT